MKRLKIFVLFLFAVITMSFLSGCVAKMPIPEVQEGRFDFSVTYEVNGEEKTYTGVYVCKFDGIYITCVGRGLEWEGYIENEEEIDIPIQTNKDGVVYLNLGFFPEYFMGDPDAEYYNVPAPSLYMTYNGDDPDFFEIIGEDEVIAGYGVKIISYEYAEPIENTFTERMSCGRFEPSIN